MKICLVEAELFHAHGRTDSQTDMMKLIVDFHNFANAPKSFRSVTLLELQILKLWGTYCDVPNSQTAATETEE